MGKIKTIISCALLYPVLFTNFLYAQQHSRNDSIATGIDSLEAETPSIEVESEYVNRVLLWGRDFGEKQSGIGLSVKYTMRKGFYLYVVPEYWSSTPNIIGFTNIGVGYERSLTDGLYVAAGYERWILHHGDDYTRGALNNNIEAHLNYDFTAFNIAPGFYYRFGYERIFQFDLSINREYTLFPRLKNGRLTVEPEALITFANQSFILIYSDYPPDFINNDNIKPADFELNVPVTLRLKNFSISATPHYNMPVKISSEQVKPFFYFSVGVAYKFSL